HPPRPESSVVQSMAVKRKFDVDSDDSGRTVSFPSLLPRKFLNDRTVLQNAKQLKLFPFPNFDPIADAPMDVDLVAMPIHNHARLPSDASSYFSDSSDDSRMRF